MRRVGAQPVQRLITTEPPDGLTLCDTFGNHDRLRPYVRRVSGLPFSFLVSGTSTAAPV